MFYVHPLSEVNDIEGEDYMNSGATASFIVDEVIENNSIASNTAKELAIKSSNNNFLVEQLITKVRRKEIAAIKELIALVEDSFNQMVFDVKSEGK